MSAVALIAVQIRPLTFNGAVLRNGVAGAVLTIGQGCYKASDGTVKVADADASKAAATAIGIVVESFDGETTIQIGDPVTYCVFGPVAGFSGMTPGQTIWISDTAGGLDTAAGTYDRIIGYAEAANILFVQPDLADPSSA